MFKYEPLLTVMGLLAYDASTFGNHEFDEGNEGIAAYLKETPVPFVSSNIDASGTPLDGLFSRYLIREIGGQKVAIVGSTTPETTTLAKPENLQFNDEIESLRQVVNELQELNIDKIVAVGHSGIAKAREICRSVQVSRWDKICTK